MEGLQGPTSLLSMQSKIKANTAAIAAGGGGGSTPKQGFSPINIASCAQAEFFEGEGNTILYLTIAEETMSIDRCTIWGVDSPGDGQVEVKYYRYGTGWGGAGSIPFLGATSAATLGDGPNDITLTAVAGGGGDTVTAGETIIVGIRRLAGTFNAVSDFGLSSKLYGVRPSNGEIPMPFPATTPEEGSEDWVDTDMRPAMTLWKA